MSRRVRAVLRAPIERRTWAELVYAIVSVPVAAAGFLFVVVTFALGVATSVTFIGLPVLALGGLGARRLGAIHRRLAGGLLEEDLPPPQPFVSSPGVLGWLQSALWDGPAWRARAYVLVKLPLALLTGMVVFVWGTSPYSLTYHVVVGRLAVAFESAAILLAGPWVLRTLVGFDRTLVRRLLAVDAGAARVAALEQARTRIADDAAALLRRIERDLHDGTQAQLGALAMNLGQAKEKLEHRHGVPYDPTGALAIIESSHRHAKEALIELRDIVRGIHPPALDLGLDAAIETLAARSAIPTTLHVDLPERPSEAIESIAYFSAAELIANALKHSRARHITIELREQAGRLHMRVRDDGIGGAMPGAGTGLTGLADRLWAMDGGLEVVSPLGGPTEITVELPLRA